MGFWAAPFLHNLTYTNATETEEFIWACVLALAGSTKDGRAAEQLLRSVVTQNPIVYGTTSPPINRALAYMKALRDGQTVSEMYRTCDRAVSALRAAGAVDDTAAVA